MLLQQILYATAPLVALTNPITELPIFLSIVADWPQNRVRRAAVTVGIGVWVILFVSAVLGLRALGLFGIELSAFRAAGGLLLIVMGLEMTLGGEAALQRAPRSQDDAEDALWVPLVMPMLAGPGAIVATVGLSIRETYFIGWIPVATTAAVTISAFVVLVTLFFSGLIAPRIPPRGRRILNRFSGLILVAIGFQMGFTGAAEFFTQYA